MKIVQINSTCGSGSTGKICIGISEVLSKNGIENYILYSTGKSDYHLGIKYTNERYVKLQALLSRINGKYGFNSNYATKRLIRKLEELKPDIIQLHNLHAHNCNLEKLFKYIKKRNIKVIWTFHDCWAVTGYCPHFQMVKCSKWKTKCMKCVQFRKYSWLFDNSRWLFEKKKTLLEDFDFMIVTPSEWLSKIIKESFLQTKKIQVINNGIDLEIFKPRYSSVREKYHIPEYKKIILGVAFGWNEKKGLDVFMDLAETLDFNKYQIILVGIDEKIRDKIPSKIISISRTQNQKELAELYSAADVFVNPTREDSFPTVNIEALACGTPVITFKTGGSPEILTESCGRVVECNDNEGLQKCITEILEGDILNEEKCVWRAENFKQEEKFYEYYKLYERALNKDS